MFILDVCSKNFKTGGKGKMKNAEKFAIKTLGVIEKIARSEVKNVLSGTSACAGIWHQPKRPKRKKD